ncbi:MAG: AmmeMemoRadiSam system protein B [Treponema sp.]|nr:AmmeMemoRadiSam system protein B [Treponema sp.]
MHYMYYGDTQMWNHIFDMTEAYQIPSACPASIMIPHHDITTGRQNSFYKALSEQTQPSVIFIVAPDHFERGKKLITMPRNTTFESPEGNIETDKKLISRIAKDPEIKNVVSIQDDLWKDEHGIFIHIPFIKHYFPNAKVVPIVVKMLSTDDEFEYFSKLGKVLAKVAEGKTNPVRTGNDSNANPARIDNDSNANLARIDNSRYAADSRAALFIASVDCSHYQIPCVTAMHDEATINTLFNKEDPRFAEIDSPESVSVLYSYNEAVNASQMMLFDHSSTFDYIPDENVECTSHLYLGFYDESDVKTEKPTGRKQTILITGSGNTGAGIRRTWKWDRYKTSTDQAEVLLRAAAGKEARFFYGFDALIFDPEPGSVYEQTVHGTTLRVHTLDPNTFYRAITAPAGDDRVNVLVDSGAHILEREVSQFLETFDIVVVRDSEGEKDAFMYYRADRSNGEVRKVNLGICHGNGKIKGAVALVNIDGDKIDVLTLDYESDNGVIPAIHQFVEE